MRYAVWNNKGGVGKSFLTFMLGTEIAKRNSSNHVILVDMCPQANLSEIVLGGNSKGAEVLEQLLSNGVNRKTVGGSFDTRISSPHITTNDETSFLVEARRHNTNLPENLWLIVGDPSLEIQAQVISQISGQTLPQNSWANVHMWLRDLILASAGKLGGSKVTTIIDCNPSFSAYTELAMLAAELLIISCSSDGSSARAIDNLGALLYGVGSNQQYADVGFHSKAEHFDLPLPMIHSILLNRSTQYNKEASKAFGAMFETIKERALQLHQKSPSSFAPTSELFLEIPDNHSVAIVCSHQGKPLYQIGPGKYVVHDQNPQINSQPLNRYKDALKTLVDSIN